MSTWSDWAAVDGVKYEAIRYEKRERDRGGAVVRIVLDRPERMNALSLEADDELKRAFLRANRDRAVGVIVLTHTGPHFGVGGDVSKLQDAVDNEVIMGTPTVDTIIDRCLKPVIAAVRGYVVGMHDHLAYHCDFTIASENAVFGQNGPRVGSPASGSMVARSAHIVAMKRARELWMRCRLLTAQEALEIGLCNAVVQDRLLEREVDRWCDELLDRVPTCIAAVKQTFAGLNAPLLFTDTVLSTIEPDFLHRPELQEAAKSFFEKRPPNFWRPEMTSWNGVSAT